ncbi:heterotrimeric G protein alpha subunit [Mucidula mucida]|nr:heterotrimeric G protein alpha subunit [Mucidula mucida]
MVFHPPETDPFYELMKPPPNETPAQMTARMKREADAQRVSDAIDEDIKHARNIQRKERSIVKLLLLGQAESGKSTTLKNFRMRYAPAAWERERSGWRAVVQLNVVRSIVTILGVLEAEMSGDVPYDIEDLLDDDSEVTKVDDLDRGALRWSDRHQLLMIKLAPLRGIDADLKRQLGSGAEPIQPSLPLAATPFDTPITNPNVRRRTLGEFAVRSWGEVVDKEAECRSMDSVTMTLAGLQNEMKALWTDRTVQTALERRKMRLPDSAGFFLNELDRIATRDYAVTDDDIVRARLRTVGIQEYQIRFKTGPIDAPRVDGAWEWRIYDVGGCRTTRAAWLPFFENTHAIIFLCPVSCFDERLEEDGSVNRLEDSTILWQSICSSKLLAKTQLILFMNKCDLLKRKLKRGVKVKKYLPSYGDRPNDVMNVVKYLREKFKDMQRKLSPIERHAYIYPTTVTDTQATAKTLESVRDGVLRENLVTSQLL